MQSIKVKDLQSALEMKAHKYAEGKRKEFVDKFYGDYPMMCEDKGWGMFRAFFENIKEEGKATSAVRSFYQKERLETMSTDKVQNCVTVCSDLIYFQEYRKELKRLEVELVSAVDMLGDLQEMVECQQ